LNGSIPLFNPHPKSLSLRERDFESGSLLPEGEGLGMRAVNLRKKKWDAPLTDSRSGHSNPSI